MRCLAGEILSKVVFDDYGCWRFTGGHTGNGYGTLSFGSNDQLGAHIVAYEIFKGKVDGKFVCHTCDNPDCCNPDHLFLGTVQTNKDDEVAKGRHAHGERHGSAVITEEAVFEIRELIVKGVSLSRIGRRYGITAQAIHHIKTKKTWRHV